MAARHRRGVQGAPAVRQTHRELYALTDHMLRDIGLRRDQIELIKLS
jgi:hypothetical protein